MNSASDALSLFEVRGLLMSLNRRRFLQSSMALPLLGADAFAAGTRTTDKVRLTWGPGQLAMYAKERGEFEKRLAADGVKVEWLGPFPNHAPTMQAVVGGSADFSFGGSTTPALAAIIAGSPLVFAEFFTSEPRTTSIIALDSSGIANVEDLVGKSVAVNRSGLGEFLLVAALEKRGVDRAKVKFVYLNPPDAAPALASGKVDAWSMWSPGVDIAKDSYHAHEIFNDGRDLDFQIDYTSFLVTDAFAKANSELVRLVLAAYRAEGEWFSNNTEEAEKIAQAKLGYSDAVRDHFVTIKRKFVFWPTNDAAFVARLQKAADWLTDHKVLPETVTVKDHLAAV
jgi:sulfonate transport system substrate-binding protein